MPHSKLRILLGFMDIANQMRVQALHLAMRGYPVRFYDLGNHYMQYTGADMLRLTESPRLDDFDVFEIFYASFGPANGRAGIPAHLKCVHHFCGTEVRQKSIAEAQNPYARVKDPREEKQREMLKRLAQLTDHCTIRDMELYDHVKPYFAHVHVVPRSVDLKDYVFTPETKNPRPLIVHAPTDTYIKGTETVIAAVEALKAKGLDFDFRLVAGLPHRVVKEIVGRADLLIDQLHIGTYGVAAIEAMAMGTPVMCYLSEYMKPSLVDDSPQYPIYPTNPDRFADDLAAALRERRWLATTRPHARAYVEKHHDGTKNVHKLLEVYHAL